MDLITVCLIVIAVAVVLSSVTFFTWLSIYSSKIDTLQDKYCSLEVELEKNTTVKAYGEMQTVFDHFVGSRSWFPYKRVPVSELVEKLIEYNGLELAYQEEKKAVDATGILVEKETKSKGEKIMTFFCWTFAICVLAMVGAAGAINEVHDLFFS